MIPLLPHAGHGCRTGFVGRALFVIPMMNFLFVANNRLVTTKREPKTNETQFHRTTGPVSTVDSQGRTDPSGPPPAPRRGGVPVLVDQAGEVNHGVERSG